MPTSSIKGFAKNHQSFARFSEQNYQLLVIDPAVADYQSLLAGVTPNTEVHILDKNRDGIEQITEILQKAPLSKGGWGDSSIHLISHGSPGTLYLGNSTLELSNIEQYRPQLQKWGIAHLYIYGCQVAAGDAGAEFLQKLHYITQASIAASNTLTGNAAKGGNWELEVKLGEIAVPVALKPHIPLTYQGILGASDLDTSFGTGGIVTTPIVGNADYGFAITIDSNGKILVAGSADNGGSNNDFALARYNSDGTLDPNFGSNGIVTTDILSDFDQGNAMTIDSNGKILVAGYAYNGSNDDFALARYNSNGSLDTTFDTDGKVTTPIGSNYEDGVAIAIYNNKILVAGRANNGSYDDFALVRYDSNGNLDPNFGSNGIVTTSFGNANSDGLAITIDSNGKILVAGSADNGGSNNDFALARYNSDGTLDTSFGTGGKVTTDFAGNADYGVAITIDSNGKILVAGSADNGSNDDFGLARYNSDGTLDTTFDTDGKVTTDILSDADYGNAITIDSNGKILVAGSANNGSSGDFGLARYNSDGTLDTTFDTDGKVTTDFASGNDEGIDITIDSNGKILVTGYANNGSNDDFALVRYGTPDIAITTPTVGAATVGPSNTNKLLYQINLAVTEVNANLTGLTLTTGGTYQTTDVSNFKLWYSTDSTFDAATDTQLSSLASVASGSNLAFTGLSRAISQNTTGYLFITTDIAASPTDARTINLAAPI